MYIKDKIKKIIEDYAFDSKETIKEALTKEIPEVSNVQCFKMDDTRVFRVYVGNQLGVEAIVYPHLEDND